MRNYCGDYNSKIKLLRTVGKSIHLDLITDESHNYRGFRAEVRLLPDMSTNRLPSIPVAPQLSPSGSLPSTLHQSKTICDDKMFQPFEGECYMVSSYPEVSWTTARRICGDISAEILVIRDFDDERKIIDFFTATSLDRFSSDLSRPVRAFWILQPKSSVFSTQEILNSPEDDEENINSNYGTSLAVAIGISKANYNQIQQIQQQPQPYNNNNSSRPQPGRSNSNNEAKSGPTNLWLSDKIVGETFGPTEMGEDYQETRKMCNIFSIDSSNHNIAYRSVECNHQAGYICKKKPVGKFDN